MNLRATIVILLLGLAFIPLAPAQEEEPKTPLEDARALKDAGEYEKARTLLLAAIEKDPENAELYLETGKVLHLQGREIVASNASLGRLALYDAKTWYGKALQKRPEWPEALQLLGSVATELADLKTAVDAWKRASDLSPENGECRYQLGYCLALLGRFDEAIVAFKEATKLLGPDPRILLNQGISHSSLKQVSDAEACFTTLITTEVAAGRQGGDFMNRGVLWLWRLHSGENRYARAEEVFARLSKKLPKVSALHWYVGHARLRQGNARGAATAFETVTELLPNWADGWRQLGGAQVQTGEYGAAEEALLAEVKLDPGGQAPWRRAATSTSRPG
jgi:tetratricopeptide (TPR) repeat protein